MFTVGYATHPGLIRKVNQDAVYAFASPDRAIAFAIVADGMGAEGSGRTAAHFSVEILKYAFHELILDELISDRTVDIERQLREATKAANKKIMDTLSKAGTTITASVIVDDLVYVVHVGDSRAYLLEDQDMRQLTVDHNLRQVLIDRGLILPSQDQPAPLLIRILGADTSIEIDAFTQAISPVDSLLLCTDGLWDMVSDQEMADIVCQNTDLQEACDQLITAANEQGGMDNIAVALIQAVV